MMRIAALAFGLGALSASALAATEADRRDCAGENPPDAKIAACTRLIEDQATQPSARAMAYRNRGNSYGNKGLHELATLDFDEALKIEPQDRQALGGRAQSYARRGQYDRGIADFNEVLRLNPRGDRAYNERGLLHLRTGDLDSAYADFESALRLNPQLVHAHNNRALVLARRGRLDEAIAGYTEALRIDPLYLLGYFNRGRALEEKGDAEQALADYKRAADGAPRPRMDEDKRSKANAVQHVKRLTAAIAEGKVGTKAAVERRVALVVGNSAYAHVPALRNPANDAKALASALRGIGFVEVREVYDADLSTLGRALKEFGDLADGADWAVIYFAGHGIEVAGVNYLLPVDARLELQAHVEDETLPLTRLMSKVMGAGKLQLVILDACRNNPFVSKMKGTGRATRSLGRGLGSIEPEGGVLVAYAAKDGTAALDGESANSPYADALVRHIGEPGLEINLLFRKIRDEVLSKTARQQEPYTYGSLPAQPFYFKR
jgi:tetratricopeptide (TPR) repeat protein